MTLYIHIKPTSPQTMRPLDCIHMCVDSNTIMIPAVMSKMVAIVYHRHPGLYNLIHRINYLTIYNNDNYHPKFVRKPPPPPLSLRRGRVVEESVDTSQ